MGGVARFRAWIVAILGLSAVAVAPLSGQPFPPGPPDRHRLVGGWRVTSEAESDGGRIVRLRQRADDFSLDYQAVFWRGNYGPIRGTAFRWRDCRSGDASAPMPPDADLTAAGVRARFEEYVAACRMPSRAATILFRNFEPAFALFAAWVEEAEAATNAENEAIENYGRDPTTEDTEPQ